MHTELDWQSPAPSEVRIPKVSIGMPVYNGEEHIREALDSVLAQTYTDFELIISDNASADGTEAICQEYVRRDSRIKYIRQPSNIGSCGNFNYLLEHTQSKYFTWLAHDDFLDASYLETIVQYLEENEDVVLCSSDYQFIQKGKDTRIIKLEEIRGDKDWEYARRNFFLLTTYMHILIYGIYRVSIIRSSKIVPQAGFMGQLLMTECTLLGKLALQGRIVSLPRVLRTYRIRGEGVAQVEVAQSKPVLQLLNAMYLILRYQVCVVVFSKLKIRSKFGIMHTMCSYDIPMLVLFTGACIPDRLRRCFGKIQCLRSLKERLRRATYRSINR